MFRRTLDDEELDRAVADYRREGYAHIPAVGDDATMIALGERARDIMQGRVTYDGLFFQLDAPSGDYEDLRFGVGWEGPSDNYRKIEKLELDPLYRAWLENPVFERIVRRVIAGAITIYRAVLFSKAAHGGSNLPFHQDAGDFWGIDRDPELQIWTALDDAPREAGCIEVVPRSHEGGLVRPIGGVVPADRIERAGAEAKTIAVPAKRGDVILIHNYVWHRSGRNVTDAPRRGFTVCYMSAATRCKRTKRPKRDFVEVFAKR
jgi:hypothetical protein